LRAAWTAEELLYEFGDRIQRLSLVPSAGGRFEVTADGRLIFSKAGEGRFPELREIKDKLRELV
jgi:selenoprotein W-related protein